MCHRSAGMLSSVLLMVGVFFIHAADAWRPTADYCKQKCTVNDVEISNVACTFYKCAPSDQKCTEFTQNKTEFRRSIVAVHNTFRNSVAKGLVQLGGGSTVSSGVANMNAFNYDFELEHFARCLANKCSFGGKCMRSAKHRRILTNVAYVYDSEFESATPDNWTEFATRWWAKSVLDKFDRDLIVDYRFKDVAAYENVHRLGNVLWAETTSIGCARSSMKAAEWLPKYRLVCAYAPGAEQGEVVFKTGKACSECQEGVECSKEYDGLCGVVVLDPVDNRASIVRTNVATVVVAVLCSDVLSSIQLAC